MKVALCGLGDRLSYVANTMHQLIPNFDLVAYADPNPVCLDQMTESGVKMQGYADLAPMMEKERPDLLMIGSPNHMHFDHLAIGLQSGAKVFCEKPIVTTEQDTFKLLQLLQQHDAIDRVSVGMVLRYSQLYKDIRNTVDSGTLGDIASIEASEHIAPEHGAFFMRDWRRHQALSGGFLLEKCSHDFDMYLSLVDSRPARVASFGSRRSFTSENADLEGLDIYHERQSRWRGAETVFGGDSDLIDNQTALVEFKNGTNFCFHTNLNVPDEFRHFCIIGARGMAEGDFVRNYYRVHDATTNEQLVDISYEYDDVSVHYGAESQMAEAWKAHFEHDAPLPVSILDALEAGLTIMKIEESRLSGKVVEMEHVWEQFDSFGAATPSVRAS